MKRYRLTSFQFDSRAAFLDEEIKNSLILEYGEKNGKFKINNFKDIGCLPISILAFHNKFFNQIRNSFVIGSYYPALTGVCALGERILNYLILILREDFKGTKEYKKVYGKKSFTNWDEAIEILKNWGVLLPSVVENFKELKEIRNKEAIHFNLETEEKARERSLKAIKIFSEIIKGQFTFYGKQPWFIEGTKGEFYIKKDHEKEPFIKKIYLPNCYLVGPYYKVKSLEGGSIRILDDYPYENREISDQEFIEMRESFLKQK